MQYWDRCVIETCYNVTKSFNLRLTCSRAIFLCSTYKFTDVLPQTDCKWLCYCIELEQINAKRAYPQANISIICVVVLKYKLCTRFGHSVPVSLTDKYSPRWIVTTWWLITAATWKHAFRSKCFINIYSLIMVNYCQCKVYKGRWWHG